MVPKLAIATPCYRSDPELAIAWAKRMGEEVGIDTIAICPKSPPWLHVARALIVGTFRETDATMMLWRDDDMDPSPATVSRLIAADVPAIVAPYVLRDDESEEKRFDVCLHPDGSVRWAGLGCALVRRAVISRLWFDHDEELHFDRQGHRYVALFRDFFAELEGGETALLCEDQAFWWRVSQAGYPIAALDDVMVPHAGEAMRWKRTSP